MTHKQVNVGREENICSYSEAKTYLIEEIIPKVEYTLEKFTAEQDMSFTKKFLRLDKNTVTQSECTISYTCELCQYTTKMSNTLQRHMEQCHTDQLNVVCIKCRMGSSITELAGNRWKHNCPFNP